MRHSGGDDRGLPPALQLTTGPDAGRAIPVGGDPIVLGRAPGRGRIADPSLEAHHLLIDPNAATVVQLAGRLPARVDGVPVGGGAALRTGTVIAVGSTRIVLGRRAPEVSRLSGDPPGAVVLGEGMRPCGRGDPPADGWSFTHQAAAQRAHGLVPITLDLDAIRRVLVTGPSADGLVRAIVAQARVRIVVTTRVAALRASAGRDRVVVAVDDRPDVDWPARDLPGDGAVIAVGASWEATVLTRSTDGSSSIQRFHAAGRVRHAPGSDESGSTCSRLDRSLVAQEVPGSDAELGGRIVGVPQPARRQ